MTRKHPKPATKAPAPDHEKLERAQACINAINAVLKRYNCALTAEAGISPDGRIVARAAITAQDKA